MSKISILFWKNRSRARNRILPWCRTCMLEFSDITLICHRQTSHGTYQYCMPCARRLHII